MSVELKLCPYCRGKADVIPDPTHMTAFILTHDSEGCVIGDLWRAYPDESRAIAAWNTRSAHAVKPLEWQPIETAPKARTKENPGRRGPYILLSNDCGTWVGCHFPEYVSGYKPKNPWASMMLNVRHMGSTKGLVPTHWMPLPGPPIDTQKDEDKQ